ncbi:MAG: phosphoribosylformylglycinamidine cyclo-ligase [Eubacteriales bacterium]
MGINYKDSGVDTAAGQKAVELMKEHVKQTYNDSVMADLGDFGAMYDIGNGDVLVSGTDGVGTKVMAAFTLNQHETIGIDCVAMCVNDIVCHGARPMFFLDYFACGKLEPKTASLVIKGVAEGCKQAGCALIGGETAEMPGFYQQGEYDLAGFSVGMVKKEKIINGKNIKAGDVLIGLASSGIHSNGFSLVRSLVKMQVEVLNSPIHAFNKTLGEELLTPTRIYVKSILELIKKFNIKGIAHITGGGFYENIPRILPEGLSAKIYLSAFDTLPVFDMLVAEAKLTQQEAYSTFNMGIGMVVAVDKRIADSVLTKLIELGETAYIMGEVVRDNAGVILCD